MLRLLWFYFRSSALSDLIRDGSDLIWDRCDHILELLVDDHIEDCQLRDLLSIVLLSKVFKIFMIRDQMPLF